MEAFRALAGFFPEFGIQKKTDHSDLSSDAAAGTSWRREHRLVQTDLKILSDLTELSKVRAFVREFCLREATDCFGEEALCEMELAANEAAANVIKHAAADRHDMEISIEAEARAEEIEIRILHQGKAFDRDSAPEPDFDGSRDGGFGLHIMESIMDEVTHTREEGKNVIRLVKRTQSIV